MWQNKKIYIPYMADSAYGLAAAFKRYKLDAEVMPVSDEESLYLGRMFTSGKECLPAIITAGDIIKITKSNNFNPKKSIIFFPTSSGPCRFGQYKTLHRIILEKLGFNDVIIYSPNQGTSLYEDFKKFGYRFIKDAWIAVACTDSLYRLYKKKKNCIKNSDTIYNYFLKKICDAVENKKDVFKILKEAKLEFNNKENSVLAKIKIGIVGEIYIRCHPFANNFLTNYLESLGCEVAIPSVAEWIFYTNFTRARRNLFKKEYLNLLKNKFINLYQHYLLKKINSALSLENETDVYKIIKYGKNYITDAIEGEAILSIGKAIDFIKNEKFCGIINVFPLTCMPGNVVTAILNSKFKSDFPEVPILNLSFDGILQPTFRPKLEAFVYQCKSLKQN